MFSAFALCLFLWLFFVVACAYIDILFLKDTVSDEKYILCFMPILNIGYFFYLCYLTIKLNSKFILKYLPKIKQ